jgi:hypothetical protein
MSAFIRKRSDGVTLDPITVKPNGKKFEIVVNESASVPTPASQGAIVLVNGIGMNTDYRESVPGTPIFVARLKRPTLLATGPLVVEVVRANGARSNQLTLQVIP